MTYIAEVPLRFHRVREGENLESIASLYNVDVNKIMADNAAVKPLPGEIVVVDLKSGSLSVNQA